MRTDRNGTIHPESSDPVDAEGLRHFEECPECLARFMKAEAESLTYEPLPKYKVKIFTASHWAYFWFGGAIGVYVALTVMR